MQETKITIKLPAEMVIHIPTLSDLSLEACMKIAATDGMKMIESKIAQILAETLFQHHKERIDKMIIESVEGGYMDSIVTDITNKLLKQ